MTIIQRGTLSGGVFTENAAQRTTLTYDTATGCANGQGRLCQAQYTGTNADAGSGLQNDSYTDTYSYSAPGEVTSKQFGVTRAWKVGQILPSASLTFTANYTYDSEGKMTSASYPLLSGCGGPGCQNPTPVAGPSYTYGFDTMGRLSTMTRTDGTSQTIANNTVYNAANQITSLGMPATGLGSGTETRTYNNLNQLTGITSPAETVTYSYPVSTNNGQIASMTSGGQTVSYTYDALGRIATASATGGTAWGQSYVFDGFGNLLQKNVTAGSAPSLTQSVNTANNQINGYSYDANGNQTGVPVPGAGTVTATYDIENRMVQLGTAGKYAYNAQNQRVWRQGTESGTTSEYFYFYGIGGTRIASYKITNLPPTQANGNLAAFSVQATDVLVYYGSKLLQEGAYTTTFSPNYVGVDRLGSMPGGKSLYPWGEEVTATANNKIKFGTYLRDGESGIDYAMNRYYSSPSGRFLTADPYRGNSGGPGDPGDPQSWNRYAYVGGDPIGRRDAWGLNSEATDCNAYPTSPACNNLPACRIYPQSPQCVQQKHQQPPIPDCYRPKAPAGASVDANVRMVEDIKAIWQSAILSLPPSEQPDAALAAELITVTWWVNQIRPGGQWDYKRKGADYETFGNFSFGATAAALGLPYYIAQNGAGLVNVSSNVITMAERLLRKLGGDDTPLPDWWIDGLPLAKWPFGDDSKDAK